MLSVSLIGLPVTGGFTAKWYMAAGALGLGNFGILGIVILMVSALLTAGYLLPIVTDAFFPGDDYDYSSVVPFKMLPLKMLIPLLSLSAGAVMTGIFGGTIVDFVNTKIIPVLL